MKIYYAVKKCLLILIAVISVMLLGVLFVACNGGADKDDIKTLQIGYTMGQVKNVMGEPDLANGTTWEYVDESYMSLAKEYQTLSNKLLTVESESELNAIVKEMSKLEQKMSSTVHTYARLKFDANDRLTTVIYDAKARGGKMSAYKTADIDNSKLLTKSISLWSNPNTVNWIAKENYRDGSYYMGAVNVDTSNIDAMKLGSYSVKWSSYFGKKSSDSKYDCDGRVQVLDSIKAGTKIEGSLGNHTFQTTVAEDCTLATLILDVSFAGDSQQLAYNKENDTYWKSICNYVTGVTIPDGITSIGSSAFYDCSSLTSITVEKGNTKYHSVGNCLIETASKTLILGCNTSVIPVDGSVTSIGSSAFYACRRLKSIKIPDSVTSIGSSAFSNCTGLKSIKIPDSVTSIGSSAFSNCTGLESIKIPSSITSIGDGVFYDCYSLTSITIPDSVTSIGKYAFSGCSLTSVTIGNSVTSIEDNAFYGFSSLTSITVESGNTKFHSAGNCLIETASRTLILGCNASVIPVDGSVTSIGSSAFSFCTGLKSIKIPSSITSIGSSAFATCTGLESIKIPNSVISIGNEAFYNCDSLKSITIPNSVTSIGRRAFYGCHSLTSIKIPDSVTSIEHYAFEDCHSLTIYCEAASKPSGWDSGWNPSNRPVVWGYKNK